MSIRRPANSLRLTGKLFEDLGLKFTTSVILEGMFWIWVIGGLLAWFVQFRGIVSSVLRLLGLTTV